MDDEQLEPGLIKVFRWFAWLRLVSLSLIPIILVRLSIKGEYPVVGMTPIIVTIADVLFLLVYLYFPGLSKDWEDGIFLLVS